MEKGLRFDRGRTSFLGLVGLGGHPREEFPGISRVGRASEGMR